MVGFDSKRKMAASRHCDDETMAHIIDLRKRLSDAETQRDNALSMVYDLRMKLWEEKNQRIEIVGGGGWGDQ